jgi:cold shock CspA family protein
VAVAAAFVVPRADLQCLPRWLAKAIVKFFNGQKGFGFIQVDDRPDDVFVHISAVEQAGLAGLAEGQPLEFTLVDRGGKVSATDLVIDGDPLPVPERAPRPERDGFDRGDRGGDRGGFQAAAIAMAASSVDRCANRLANAPMAPSNSSTT